MKSFPAVHHRLAPRRRPLRLHERLEARLLLDAAGGPAAAYGQLPLSFEINQGQADSQVNFLAHGSGYGLFLTPNEAVLQLQAAPTPTRSASEAAPLPVLAGASGSYGPDGNAAPGNVLRMQFIGANPDAQASGVDKLPGVTNYLIGNDPSNWHTNVPNYGSVEYHNLYAGIDLTYYGNQRQLEYDFTVAPGADPSQIAFNVAGAKSVSLDAQGELVLHTSGGDVIEHAPVIYQPTAGGERPVDGHYTLSAEGRVGFAVGNYNHSQPLVIDPILSYSSYLGGSDDDSGTGIAVNAAGEAYVAGIASSTDFPATPGALQTKNAGAADVFVAKLNTAGNALIYATYLGGNNNDFANALALDAAGNVYLAGGTDSTNFPTTPGAPQTTSAGSGDGFVVKLNAAGSGLVYSTLLGGSGGDDATHIALDASGDAYVTGFTFSNNFPTTPGAMTTVNVNPMDGFVTKINAAGNGLSYSTYLYLGGTQSDNVAGIAVDAAGDAYVVGRSTDKLLTFYTPPGAVQESNAGGFDAVVEKLNATGSGLVYATYLGGSGDEYPTGIAVDSTGDAYVTGNTNSTNFPTTASALQTSISGTQDAFVTKLNAAASSLAYSTYLGGSGTDNASAIALDSANEAYVAGYTNSTDFPTTPGAPQSSLVQFDDAFVTRIDAAGKALLYATYLGGSGGDSATAIALDATGAAYVAGSTNSTNFPVTPGALQTSFAGGSGDAIVARLATAPPSLQANSITAMEGAPFSGVVGFLLDQGHAFDPPGNFTSLVAWGDGTTSHATLVPYQNGFNLIAGHLYPEAGNYTIGLTATDAGGDTASAAGMASVSDAPLHATGTSVSATAGTSITATVATFSDGNSAATPSDFTATIEWGDHTSLSTVSGSAIAQSAPGAFSIAGSHLYAAAGNYTITVTIHDVGGSSASTTNSAAVAPKSKGQGALGLVEDVYVIGSGTITVSAANGVLANDTGPSQLTVISGTVAGAEGGTFVFHADGSFTYTPPANFPGFDYAKYSAKDASGDQDAATVNVLSQIGGVVWKFYEQVLDRDPEYTGLQFWINHFNSGGKTGDIAVGFFESTELLNQIITGYYQQYLGRAPQGNDLPYWEDIWRKNGGPELIKAQFASSPEFNSLAIKQYGAFPDGWLEALYHRILGRAPQGNDLPFWEQKLATGTTEGQVTLDFFTSPEADAGDVTGWFNEYLGRAPTAAELSQYVNQIVAGASDRDIEQAITNLPEYSANPPASPAGTGVRLPDYLPQAAGAKNQAAIAATDAVFAKLA